ncbi:MAG: flagellar basal body P-ring formation chaperone FlgA [Aeromonas sobria]
MRTSITYLTKAIYGPLFIFMAVLPLAGYCQTPATTTLDLPSLTLDVTHYWQELFEQWAQTQGWRDAQVQIEVVLPSGAAQLFRCKQPYQFTSNARSLKLGQQRVHVYCPDTPGWTLMVRGRIQVTLPALMTLVNLDKQQIIQASDLVYRPIQVASHQHDVLVDLARAVGRRPIRPIAAGTPLRNRYLEAALLVHKGDKVKLTIGEEGWQIALEGLALDNAQLGERVQVKNERSGKILSAIVIGVGKVSVVAHLDDMQPPTSASETE